jgi:hypothetical protein
MNAEDARKLTQESLMKGQAFPREWVEAIERKIEAAAKRGESSIIGPFSGMRMLAPSSNQVKLIRLHFATGGFEWLDHPDPDPGNPMSRPYTEIKW